ncbi:hypothetical protein TREMEDRAFT_61539 [Tremella mesenterica DSM 1558]|uniref:uncharacterized protein n=1 Tax=Tremella mesenterica (strain ATCC 24925 / CBS 8224 / DSM 1558 / NBRC 9311 / NRRL Y-6157 / RJB 2259-6 / UBC 559-6) TaxID=578456 RepID=UPI0003F4A38B|nr:uncharacterized protein TREMEDRAFT_61539 [Tremella mesenterica DSM 1558]EIW69773.1 hypothetical protein TREMEDRAFT_61539 [Tremella mesenterica DSM 1558]
MPPPAIPTKRKATIDLHLPTLPSPHSGPSRIPAKDDSQSLSDVSGDDEEYIPTRRKRTNPGASGKSQPGNPSQDRGNKIGESSKSGGIMKEVQRGENSRGGQKVGGGGKQLSREQLRKANHSLIERRRREKINFALQELRGMVPGLGETKGGGEFKLEVLERTVVHMRELKARVEELERGVSTSSVSSGLETSVEWLQRGVQMVEEHPEQQSGLHNSNMNMGWEGESGEQDSEKGIDSPPSPDQTPSSEHSSLHSGENLEQSQQSTPQPPFPAYQHAHPSLSRNKTSDIIPRDRTSHPTDDTFRPPNPIPDPSAVQKESLSNSRLPTRPDPSPTSISMRSHPIYLPFPTPSPTSPFLTHPSVNQGMEPSPFLAPLQNISLFGGALNLDALVSAPSSGSPESLPDVSTAKDNSMDDRRRAKTFAWADQASVGFVSGKDMNGTRVIEREASDGDVGLEIGMKGSQVVIGESKMGHEEEEAANLLLAFSSPDTLRPVQPSVMSKIPSFLPSPGEQPLPASLHSSTTPAFLTTTTPLARTSPNMSNFDSHPPFVIRDEHRVVDVVRGDGVTSSSDARKGRREGNIESRPLLVGKTARDILRM